ncbi:hypothetical protein BLOT_000573 [Blomia tropicalis]|nr:hypothetical protein BLOT_000573 [Blomia tropicalis]
MKKQTEQSLMDRLVINRQICSLVLNRPLIDVMQWISFLLDLAKSGQAPLLSIDFFLVKGDLDNNERIEYIARTIN